MSNIGTNIRIEELNKVEELIVKEKEKDTPASAKSEVS